MNNKTMALQLLAAVDAMPSDGNVRLLMEALSATEREGMRRGYLAGFKASGEGWNGEYPFSDDGRAPETDTDWIYRRDAVLAVLP